MSISIFWQLKDSFRETALSYFLSYFRVFGHYVKYLISWDWRALRLAEIRFSNISYCWCFAYFRVRLGLRWTLEMKIWLARLIMLSKLPGTLRLLNISSWIVPTRWYFFLFQLPRNYVLPVIHPRNYVFVIILPYLMRPLYLLHFNWKE